MLGLSIGCARCHDHKFDPIPQADYYRFISTFTTTVRSNLDVNVDPSAYAQAKAAFDAAHAPYRAAREKFEAEQLGARFVAWEATPAAAAAKATPWRILPVSDAKSKGGATLTPQDDGAVLALAQVRLEAQLVDAVQDVLDLVLRAAGFENDDHVPLG